MEEVRISVAEIVDWTDEQCESFDASSKISMKEVRTIVQNYKATLEDLMQVSKELDSLRNVLKTGSMQGYVIVCPDCKVSYKVTPNDINYDKEIVCQDCGAKYLQTKNIFGIYTRENNNAS